jgi:hypothetical protein
VSVLSPIRYTPRDIGDGIDLTLTKLPVEVVESAVRAGGLNDTAHSERLARFIDEVSDAGYLKQLGVVALLTLGAFAARQAGLGGDAA